MSVITLDQAKLYLRLEDPLDDQTEAELQSFIDAAEGLFTTKTGWQLNPTKKTYTPDPSGKIRVYDWPILTDISHYTHEMRSLHTVIYHASGPIELELGYQSASEVPDEFVSACLQILKSQYYESEEMEKTGALSPIVSQIVNTYKRFIL